MSYYFQCDDEQITEEQFLKERNLNMKNRLLEDSSSESEVEESDEDEPNEKKLNGVHENGGEDSDQSSSDNALSDSDDSIMGKFLNKKISESNHLSRTSADEVVDSDAVAEEKNSSASANKRQDVLGPNLDKLLDELPVGNGLNDVDELVADLDNHFKEIGDAELEEAEKDDARLVEKEKTKSPSSSESDEPITKKSKAQIGKKVFGNLDKSLEIISPDEKTDDETSETSRLNSKITSKNNSDCEILDTSMFKKTKTKNLDGAQLTKILSNSNRQKTTSTRAIPDDCISLSSDSDLEMEPVSKSTVDEEAGEDAGEEKSKRSSRPMLRTDQLAGETKRAQREENDRVKRLEKKQDRLSQIIASQQIEDPDSDDNSSEVSEVILDYDSKKKERIFVHKEIVKHLKPHQIDGIKFMYDCCYGSVDSIEKYPGSGCILAHCMGLGKTLQVFCYFSFKIEAERFKCDPLSFIKHGIILLYYLTF